MFVRCAKSLLLAGPAAEAQQDRVVGMPLELVAERNPYLLTSGQSLSVRLLYKDQPLAGALVVALNQRDPMARVAARSDKDGRVTAAAVAGGAVAGQGRAHDSGAGRVRQPVGELLGVADVRACRTPATGPWTAGGR